MGSDRDVRCWASTTVVRHELGRQVEQIEAVEPDGLGGWLHEEARWQTVQRMKRPAKEPSLS
jgi:hypothetical protein